MSTSAANTNSWILLQQRIRGDGAFPGDLFPRVRCRAWEAVVFDYLIDSEPSTNATTSQHGGFWAFSRLTNLDCRHKQTGHPQGDSSRHLRRLAPVYLTTVSEQDGYDRQRYIRNTRIDDSSGRGPYVPDLQDNLSNP